MIRLFLIFIVIIFFSGCYSKDKVEVSLISLLVNQNDYEGKSVVTTGYFFYDFESVALYLTSEHSDYGLAKNAIWLNFKDDVVWQNFDEKSADIDVRLSEINDQYVTIEGVYEGRRSDAVGVYGGTIEVKRVVLRRSRRAND